MKPSRAKKPEIKWQFLERMVREIAELKFSGVARAENIAGVKCDCVIDLKNGSVVIIEISKEDSIEKLRTDLSKFNVIRPHFFAKGIFPRCFFVTLRDPTPALIEAGNPSFVTVYSVSQFFNFALGSDNYIERRRKEAFGSAIDLYSGEPDENEYVRVDYFSDTGESFSTDKISSELLRGKTVVLIGDYGTGKSRCVKEVFANLVESRKTHYQQPIAVNLRDNWGLKRAQEVITRHFTDLGLEHDIADALKVAFTRATIYLLDGFDEIGAQTWSDDPTKLVDIRKQSLVGIKDLIQHAKGGVLVTGREHYFNDDAELIECLGLNANNVLFLRCNQELTDQQFSQLIGGSTQDLPRWLPKKPLIGVIVRDIEPEIVRQIFSTGTGQIDFWELLLNTFCEREAKINPILDASIIRALYVQLGRLLRVTQGPLGPISIKQINEAFERTTGRPPTDESAIILQRLPGLSRVGAESLDRQFVDEYILDGLKAEDLSLIYSESPVDVLNAEWRHQIGEFGALYLSITTSRANQIPGISAFVKRHNHIDNRVLLSDMISALFKCDGPKIDLGRITLTRGRFTNISLSESIVTNIVFDDCLFENIDFTDSNPHGIVILASVIMNAAGVTSPEHLPDWVKGCLVEKYQSISTLTAIKEAGLNIAQTFLLSSLRKLFLQPGAGRKHSSMYKGYGNSATKRICEKVIALLLRDGFCNKFRGTTEDLYIPDRSKTGRVMSILSHVTQSKDTLWAQASRLDD